jgi:hypothetical protein
MKRILVVALAAACLGALLYATTAPAGRQAVTPKQFAALQKRVKTLENVVNVCFQKAVPVTQYDGYQATDTNNAPLETTALDRTDTGDTPDAYLLDVGQACASALGTQFRAVHVTPTLR